MTIPPSLPPSIPPPVGRSGGRRQLRAKRRKERQRLIAAGFTAVVVLLALITVVLVKNGGKDSTHHKTSGRTQKTVLFQIKGSDGAAASSALLADDRPSKTGAIVLIQSQVLANVPGQGSVVFGKALQNGGVTGARNALSDLMGVTIDGSWVIDAATFERLVDQLGGVNVTVDATVIANRVTVLNPGPQHLTGAQALEFATYLGPGEEENIRLTRLQAVLDAMITELPKGVSTLIGSLGSGSTSTLSIPALSSILEGLESDDKADNLEYQSLPVTKVDLDQALRYRVDPDATKTLIGNLLSQSVPAGVLQTGNRVYVLNGVGTPGVGQEIRNKLVPAGFVYIGSRNADHFGYKQTIVLVPSGTTKDVTAGDGVAKALGVPLTAVETTDTIGTIADVVVIVGDDFKN